jgi:hypothetical protein
MSLPLVHFASRHAFASMNGIRRIYENCDSRFIPYYEIKASMISKCEDLGNILSLDPIRYLDTFGGIPGLVKGASKYSGMKVYNESLTHYTLVGDERVKDNKIKFGYGKNEFVEARSDCWEFVVKVHRVFCVKLYRQVPGEIFPLVLSRPDDTACPICFDDLSSNVIECANKHQICIKCFEMLNGEVYSKKCGVCRGSYTNMEICKYNKTKPQKIRGDSYFAFPYFDHIDAHRTANAMALYLFRALGPLLGGNFKEMLVSTFYNWVMEKHRNKYNLTELSIGGYIMSSSLLEESNVIKQFIDALFDEEESKWIIKDVSYTHKCLSETQYSEFKFLKDLRELEGDHLRLENYATGHDKYILKNEIYFRQNIKQHTRESITDLFKEILKDFTRGLAGPTGSVIMHMERLDLDGPVLD